MNESLSQLPFSFLIGSYVLFNLPLTFLEWMRFKPLQKYKIQEDVYISPAENRHCLLMLARNYLGTMAPMVMLAYPLFRLLFSISMEDVPLWWEVVLQCAAFAVIEDSCVLSSILPLSTSVCVFILFYVYVCMCT